MDSGRTGKSAEGPRSVHVPVLAIVSCGLEILHVSSGKMIRSIVKKPSEMPPKLKACDTKPGPAGKPEK